MCAKTVVRIGLTIFVVASLIAMNNHRRRQE